MLSTLAIESLKSRKKTAILTLVSLMISITVLLMVEHLRSEAKNSFSRSISGTDLIVGAPSGDLNLLLYAIFRMGNPTNNIQYSSFETLRNTKHVSWAIPISLGDSHRGYRVLGTSKEYFTHFRYGEKRPLSFSEGKAFSDLFDVVIGSKVASTLNYKIGDNVVIAHGLGSTSFTKHDHAPFRISGILAPTGTPVDNTLHVSLAAIEAIHIAPGQLKQIVDSENYNALEPTSITAILLGLDNKFAIFGLQRYVNNFEDDRLMAVLPGVAMTQLWQLMSNVENLLRVIAFLVLLSSLFGLTTMLIASMNERSVEIAVLRTLGASPFTLFKLIIIEALTIAILAFTCAFVLVSISLWALSDWLIEQYGLFISAQIWSTQTLILLMFILISVLIAAIAPAYNAYKKGLQTQLNAT